ncbi:hypothetical protein D9M69_695410 [compost metagenome]
MGVPCGRAGGEGLSFDAIGCLARCRSAGVTVSTMESMISREGKGIGRPLDARAMPRFRTVDALALKKLEMPQPGA